MTDSVLARIKKNSIKRGSAAGTPTGLYQNISTAKEFGINPVEFKNMSMVDRKILSYFRLMEGYYLDMATAENKQPALPANMPRLKGR